MKHYQTSGRAQLTAYLAAHAAARPQSAKEICEGLAGGAGAPGNSSVYRLLSVLCEEGVLHRSQDESGGAVYQYVEGGGAVCRTHFHLQCTVCGRVTHLTCGCGEEIAAILSEEHGFAGVIMLTVESSPGMIALLRNYTLPVVLVNRFIRSLDMDVVSIDNYRGGYMAASYLLEHGHRCVAYLAGKRESTAQQDRLRGFTDAMADAGISFRQQNVFWGDNTRDSGRDFAGSFFGDHAKGKYTAVFAANNPMAVGALTRLLELGGSVPLEISMICFDDVTPARDGSIKLTTISYDPYLMGTTAVDSLMKRIEKPHQEKIKSTFSPHVTVRDSVKDISASIDKHL